MTLETVKQARLWAMREAPYFSRALFSLRFIGKEGLPAPMLMDLSGNLYYDTGPTRQDPGTLGLLLIREVHRLVRLHAKRRGNRSPETWALACTLAINDDLRFLTPQPETLGLDPYETEEVYFDKLPPGAGGGGGGGATGSAADGLPREWEDSSPNMTPTETNALSHQTAQAVRNHRGKKEPDARSKSPGDSPAGLKRWARNHGTSKVSWQDLLRRDIDAVEPDPDGDFSFSRRDHRRPPPVIYPTPMSTPQPTVHVVIDTSGSMGPNDLSACLRELAKVLSIVDRVLYLAGDTRVEAKGTITTADQANLVGGGGTDMAHLCIEAAPGADLVICLTDGYTGWPSEPLPCPLIVATTGEAGPSWAKTILIETEATDDYP